MNNNFSKGKKKGGVLWLAVFLPVRGALHQQLHSSRLSGTTRKTANQNLSSWWLLREKELPLASWHRTLKGEGFQCEGLQRCHTANQLRWTTSSFSFLSDKIYIDLPSLPGYSEKTGPNKNTSGISSCFFSLFSWLNVGLSRFSSFLLYKHSPSMLIGTSVRLLADANT